MVLPRVDSSGETTGTGHTCTTGSLAFGMCIMSEGRCYLSYLTGESPNTVGACSRPLRWQQTPRAGIPPERSADRPLSGRRNAGYPTLCKGRYLVDGERYHALEEPTSLNTGTAGVNGGEYCWVKIEGRQRSPICRGGESLASGYRPL